MSFGTVICDTLGDRAELGVKSRDPRPPQLGFNNNVKYAGRTFHIQTEDSGVNHPHITTHLFADGGRILKSHRTDYSELLGRDELAEVVRKRMKEQHKAMFLALRNGELDVLIDAAFAVVAQVQAAPPSGSAAPPKVAPPPKVAAPGALAKGRSDRVEAGSARAESSEVAEPGEGASAPGAAVESPGVPDAREPEPEDPNVKSSVRVSIGQGASSPVSHPQPSWPSHPSGRYHATRPAAIFNATGPSSLFGAEPDPIDEQSLDDVILSYISEDLDTTGSE